MSGDVTDFYVHTVTVEPLQGTGAAGPVYGAPATVACYLDGKVHLIRGATGEQVVSQATLYCSLADGARFAPDSRVTTPDGRHAQVITVNSLDVAGMLAGVEHVAVYLT